MDNPLTQAGSGLQRSGGLLTSVRVFGRILDWLAALIRLTDEQQEEAGVYLGDRRCR
jgi:hypothetical protein